MDETAETPDPRVLLLWAKRYANLFIPLSHNISREVASYLIPLDSVLIVVTKSSLRIINVQGVSCTSIIPLKIEIRVDGDSAWTTLGSDKLVVCGGSGGKLSAYLLDRKGGVEQLPNMAYGRSSPGIIEWEEAVLVFGTYMGNGNRKCEKFVLACKQWSGLPDMNEPRSYFRPAKWQKAVYLCGGYCLQIEVFDGVSMNSLELRLPESARTLACTYDDKLLILTTSYYITLSKSADSATPVMISEGRQFARISTCHNPVLWKQVVYIHCEGELIKCSAEDGHKLE